MQCVVPSCTDKRHIAARQVRWSVLSLSPQLQISNRELVEKWVEFKRASLPGQQQVLWYCERSLVTNTKILLSAHSISGPASLAPGVVGGALELLLTIAGAKVRGIGLRFRTCREQNRSAVLY